RDEYAATSHAHCGDGARFLVHFEPHDARTSHLESLFDDPSQRAITSRIATGEITAQRGTRASRRRIFLHTDQRREHPGTMRRSGQLRIVAEHEYFLRPVTLE